MTDRNKKLIELGAETLANALLDFVLHSDAADNLIERLIATPKENIQRFKKKLSSLKRSKRFIAWRGSSETEFLIFTGQAEEQSIEAWCEDETIWLTQQLMAVLFLNSKQNISYHIRSIYKEGELIAEATVKKYLTVRQEGKQLEATAKGGYDS